MGDSMGLEYVLAFIFIILGGGIILFNSMPSFTLSLKDRKHQSQDFLQKNLWGAMVTLAVIVGALSMVEEDKNIELTMWDKIWRTYIGRALLIVLGVGFFGFGFRLFLNLLKT